MKKSFFVISVLLLISFSSRAVIKEKKDQIYFETAKAELTKAAKIVLSGFVKDINQLSDFEIFIEGHTDSRGTTNFNEELSLLRSNAVKEYLISKGVKVNQVHLDYKGESAPALPNTNERNMRNNRRVEIYLRSYYFENVEELEAELNRNNISKKSFEPTKPNLINGKNGSKVYIPAGAFVTADGTVYKEKVQVELIESLTYKDFLASGLQTISNGELLETGGMIKLSATSEDGEPLQLADGKKMMVSIPAKTRKNDMNVFLSESGSNWTNTGVPITNRFQILEKVEYPLLRSDQTPFPTFRYSVPQPKKPKAPMKIREPHKPKAESYKRRIPWYSLNKGELRVKQNNNYAKAMDRYDVRMAKYRGRMIRYESQLQNHHKKIKEYEQEVQQWNTARSIAQERFVETPEYQRVLRTRMARNKLYREKYDEAVSAWRTERKERAAEWGEGMDAMGMTTEEDLNSYVFQVSDLKWINVDKFNEAEFANRQNITLESDDVSNNRVNILFREIKSMISCNPMVNENYYVAHNVPTKAEAYVFAYKVLNGKPMMCYMPLNGGDKYELKFEETSFAEIKEVLGQLEEA